MFSSQISLERSGVPRVTDVLGQEFLDQISPEGHRFMCYLFRLESSIEFFYVLCLLRFEISELQHIVCLQAGGFIMRISKSITIIAVVRSSSTGLAYGVFGSPRPVVICVNGISGFISGPHLRNIEELEPFLNQAFQIAALDYTVSVKSDIFIPSYSGNMAMAVEGV
ncbi:hypothetical protein M9H77_23009 [Catharanthus roseus]|uniref:Uncharacterized protein n=1 Tax=Catharanthus roseus TaxID=4058 RepID=A0ACC0ASH6_CATRO|nr:hypothetical protein M9H77_23009 [Catharanthus roseus]